VIIASVELRATTASSPIAPITGVHGSKERHAAEQSERGHEWPLVEEPALDVGE
jgi:hypothetical protein